MLKFVKFAVVAAVLACVAHPVLAQTAAERYRAGMSVLTERFGPPQEFRDPPLKSDPVVAKSLSDIKSSMEVFGTDAFPVDGLNTVGTVCVPLSPMPVRYMLGGVTQMPGAPAAFPTTPAEINALLTKPATMEYMARNAVKYQDEVAIFVAVGVKCMGLHMPVVMAFWDGLPPEARTPERLAGLRSIRDGTEKMVRGAVMSAVDPSISAKNRQLIVSAVADNIDYLAQTMSVADRKRLLNEAIGIAPGFKTSYPKEYGAISAALTSTKCDSLCLVP